MWTKNEFLILNQRIRQNFIFRPSTSQKLQESLRLPRNCTEIIFSVFHQPSCIGLRVTQHSNDRFEQLQAWELGLRRIIHEPKTVSIDRSRLKAQIFDQFVLFDDFFSQLSTFVSVCHSQKTTTKDVEECKSLERTVIAPRSAAISADERRKCLRCCAKKKLKPIFEQLQRRFG